MRQTRLDGYRKQIEVKSEDDWKKDSDGAFKVEKITFSSVKPDKLTEDAETALADLANRLRQWPQYYLRIEGNTASEGDSSQRRWRSKMH